MIWVLLVVLLAFRFEAASPAHIGEALWTLDVSATTLFFCNGNVALWTALATVFKKELVQYLFTLLVLLPHQFNVLVVPEG